MYARRCQRLVVVSVLCLLPIQAGCVGSQARESVAIPAAVMAAPGIVADARAGVESLPAAERPQAAATVEEFAAALSSKKTVKDSFVSWPQVKRLALLGIDTKLAQGKIGPIVAGELRERLTQFESVVSNLR